MNESEEPRPGVVGYVSAAVLGLCICTIALTVVVLCVKALIWAVQL